MSDDEMYMEIPQIPLRKYKKRKTSGNAASAASSVPQPTDGEESSTSARTIATLATNTGPYEGAALFPSDTTVGRRLEKAVFTDSSGRQQNDASEEYENIIIDKVMRTEGSLPIKEESNSQDGSGKTEDGTQPTMPSADPRWLQYACLGGYRAGGGGLLRHEFNQAIKTEDSLEAQIIAINQREGKNLFPFGVPGL